jgi:transcriptional regulator NrdR
MKCPICGYAESKVIDSRPSENSSIRRRRECMMCLKRFTTYEIIDSVPVVVVKKDGHIEEFDKKKILSGLMKSCYKRPVSTETMENIVKEVEYEIQNSLYTSVTSSEIGFMVMQKLRTVDAVSYVRFASVYREFNDVETFMEELKGIQEEKI